ncbi:zinc ribbon domain-containing protein [Maritalea mobilis]|uniref:zinc ribbon domain-containing protein n=1 Tax=Maritalea mobilis TaxID=483324 RepID=UPI0027DEE483|nr:zinc ribbon domain-containing protein [Maritalea mobilis]
MLWERAKARQSEIDASPRVQGIKASRFWEYKRKTHLLTGLLYCGCCGGGFASVGKDYLACSAARKLGTCEQRRGFRRERLETAVLDLLRERLMPPDAVAEFIKAFTAEMNHQRGRETADRGRLEKELQSMNDKLDGLYDAIAEGLRTPGLRARLEDLETRKAALEASLEAPAPSPVRLHPNLSELYRKKVAHLSSSLANPEIRTLALEIIRGLIDRVTVHAEADGNVVLELEGALSAMIEAAQPGALGCVDHGSVKVVAGVGFEPTTFRL